MMSTKDYYKILGVSENASPEQIKKAYRSRALKYHPDRVEESKKAQAEEKFKDISEAYYCLSDKNRRTEYDAYRHGSTYGYQGDFAQAHGFDFEEILRNFRGFSRQSSQRHNSYSSGSNFDDIFSIFDNMGSSRGNTTHHYVFGSNGLGHEYIKQENTDVHANLNVPGHILKNGGEAKFNLNGTEITLKIKAGTKQGQKLRLKQQGKKCSCCKHKGDLFVIINE